MVSPGQQHGGKQVPRAHKHSVHFGNVHADFMTGNCPIWVYYNEEKQVNKPLKKTTTWQLDWSCDCLGRLPIFWLPRATRYWSPCLEGRSVLVRTTVSGPILWSKSITWIRGQICLQQNQINRSVEMWSRLLTCRASSSELIFLPVNSLCEGRRVC